MSTVASSSASSSALAPAASKPVIDFVIEHLESDDAATKTVPEWVSLEYTHMLALSPASSTVHFTSLSSSSAASFLSVLEAPQPHAPLPGHGATPRTHTEGILSFLSERNIPLSQCCLLDPKAPLELSPSDGNEFKVFLFGGILGDDPPLDRTKVLRAMGFPGRHLGPIQMTTDTALGVTKRVVCDGIPLQSLPFIKHPTLNFTSKDAVEMPFIYLRQTADERRGETGEGNEGEPLMPRGMRDLLRRDLDRAWEFDNE